MSDLTPSVGELRSASGIVQDRQAECSHHVGLPMIDAKPQVSAVRRSKWTAVARTRALRVPDLGAQNYLQNPETPQQCASPRPLTWGFEKSG